MEPPFGIATTIVNTDQSTNYAAPSKKIRRAQSSVA